MQQRGRDALKGVSIGDKLSYNFYDGNYQSVPMLFLQPKSGNPTPRACAVTANRLEEIFGLPVVFILQPGPNYERQRLLDKGVYFVMSEKFAHLPMLMAMDRSGFKKKATRLTPVAQYLLLYHMQVASIAHRSANELSEVMPYSYSSITLGMTCLDDLELARKSQQEDNSKVLGFTLRGKELWVAAEPYLINPLERRIYCDQLLAEEDFPICGINALAHYSSLNPDKEQMLVVTPTKFRQLQKNGLLENMNEYDGDVILEVWKYPVIDIKGGGTQGRAAFVDPLSLALSLKDDNDPRVEGEVERMIENIEWKD